MKEEKKNSKQPFEKAEVLRTWLRTHTLTCRVCHGHNCLGGKFQDYAWKKVQKPPSTRPRHEHTHIRVTDTQTKHDASCQIVSTAQISLEKSSENKNKLHDTSESENS